MSNLSYKIAGVAQLVERHLAKVVVVGSNPITRSFLFNGKNNSFSPEPSAMARSGVILPMPAPSPMAPG
jgi:hypothetical protein